MALLVVAALAAAYLYWHYSTDGGKDPGGCGGCLYSAKPNASLANTILSQRPAPSPIKILGLSSIELDKETSSGWGMQARYSFSF